MEVALRYQELFENRHNNADEADRQAMLAEIGVTSVEELINQTIPSAIRRAQSLNLPPAQTEFQFLDEFKKLASQNKVYKSYIGTGYYDTYTPNVILRNILENPAWYTAYTPYQAEISQGRLEMLLNFQTLIIELTGLEIANASLLDEATASLDVDNETLIQEALSRLIRNKTVLIIAHRMRTVANADKIVVLSGGCVAESGTPQKLEAKQGVYAHMLQTQKDAASWTL